MARPKSFSKVAVVTRFLIFIANDKAKRCAGADPFENTRKPFHRIGFAALGNDCALPGPAAVELLLHRFQVKRDACRKMRNNTTIGSAVTFTKGGKSE